jgi:hypothetical protein
VIAPEGGTVTGITTGTSAESGSCASATATAPEQVFAWTPTVSGVATIQTCGKDATSFDTVVYVRSGGCEDGREVACNDDTSGCETGDDCMKAEHHGSFLSLSVTAGRTYFIFVDGFTGSCGGSSGSFGLTVTAPSGTCENPLTIPPEGGSITGITSGKSAETGPCARETARAPEQVFQWKPARSGVATIQTCGATTTFDTVVYVRTKRCTGGVKAACNDDAKSCGTGDGCTNAGHHGSRLTRKVTAGRTYYIIVDGFAGSCGGSSGTFGLTVTPPSDDP